MAAGLTLLSVAILICLHYPVEGWHGFDNTQYHCWNLSAKAFNPEPYNYCPGIQSRWLEAPKKVRLGTPFTLRYNLHILDGFYDWAFENEFFKNVGASIASAAEAKTWCENTTCPDKAADAKITTCCVHHVNVHSCPMENTTNGLCGPWVPKHGEVFTHSQVLVGPITSVNWTSSIPDGLFRVGTHSLIAHWKIAGMQVALERTINVLPRAVCGDGKCMTKEKESCETCPADCGKCPMEDWVIAVIAGSGGLILLSFIAMGGYIYWQKRKLLWNEDWIIPPDMIKDDEGVKGAFGSMVASMDNLRKSVGSLNLESNQVFTRTCRYQDTSCAVRRITKPEFSLTRKVRLEVRTVRKCDHPNVVKFIGACIEVPHMCILNEYCAKGSLNDVLQNEDIPINWAFRFSFLVDIAKGIGYLHSRNIIHGRIKSSNCVVDDRWVVKISDYGLETLRQDVYGREDNNENEERLHREKQNWVYLATEMKKLDDHTPSVKGDVYAYGVVMLEIATRSDPFGGMNPSSLDLFWKPPMPDFAELDCDNEGDSKCPCPEAYNELLEQCMNNDPLLRPTTNKIKSTIRKINPSRRSAIDLMMQMMVKYSNHLESIVAERTNNLTLEKAKTDKLLYSMLPKKVADTLRQGHPIDSQYHEICTIYFSDIVGFTVISSSSKPMQVVALLNQLYVTFDEIIDKYDVYKVETIGDAYMVVSGIPEYTEHHARECCDMSIELVKACEVFVIPHMPKEPLKVRVGLHTGPACAGVVGIKMPRYCLFGDTVNTASRMESNSEAYKIHASGSCYEQLVRYGKYILESRGTLEIKGKGKMNTWWVHGYDPVWADEQNVNTSNRGRRTSLKHYQS